MKPKELDRINELARLKKTRPLTPEETAEQEAEAWNVFGGLQAFGLKRGEAYILRLSGENGPVRAALSTAAELSVFTDFEREAAKESMPVEAEAALPEEAPAAVAYSTAAASSPLAVRISGAPNV